MVEISQVKAFIIDNFLFGNDEGLAEDTSFLDNSIIDSLGMMELIAYLEKTFQIVIDEDEMIPENLDSLKRIEGFLTVKAGAQKEIIEEK